MKNFEDMGLIEMAKTLGEMGDELKKEKSRQKVYCVLDDSKYPARLHSIFAQERDAQDFANTLSIYIVEEYEVIP